MDFLYRVMDAVLPFEPFRYTFMKNALLAMLLLTPLLALLGLSSLIPKMSMFTLAISCLTTSNLP